MRHFIRHLLIALLPLSLASCHGPQRASADPVQMTRISDDEVKSLDPQAVSDLSSLRIAADQFEGLTRFNGFGKVELGLAKSWTMSPDGLVWRFPMRDGLRFSDGAPITAQTMVVVFNRLRTTAAPTKSLFSAIGAVAADGETVVVRLNTPFPALPELMAHPVMAALPLHRAHWTRERPLVTSGAYRLAEWALNDHITLERNPQWHDGAAAIPRVRWQPVTDSLSALRLFQAGGADTTSDFPSSRLDSLRASMPAAVHVAPYNGIYYFVFNTRRAPFNDVRVRRALNMAVDRDWLAGPLLRLGNESAWGFVPPAVGLTPAYQPAWSARSRAENLAQAAALLRAAGYGPAHPLNFDIRFNSDSDHRRVAIALAAMWKPLGVEAHLLNTEASLHFASLRRGDFTFARSGWIGDLAAPENYLGVFRGDAGPVNYAGYNSPKFGALLNAGLAETDPARRAARLRLAEIALTDDAPAIPITFYVSKSLVAARVGGWHDNPSNIHPSRTLTLQ